MDAFVGEIRAVGFSYVPQGWLPCYGQLLDIRTYAPLYALLGTIYGGDGVTNFALPNLQGVFPLGQGQGPGLAFRPLGSQGGQPTVTLTTDEIPSHNHLLTAVPLGTTSTPAGNVFGGLPHGGRDAQIKGYASTLGAGAVNLNPAVLANAGSSQSHNNMPPFLALNFIICCDGEFPIPT